MRLVTHSSVAWIPGEKALIVGLPSQQDSSFVIIRLNTITGEQEELARGKRCLQLSITHISAGEGALGACV